MASSSSNSASPPPTSLHPPPPVASMAASTFEAQILLSSVTSAAEGLAVRPRPTETKAYCDGVAISLWFYPTEVDCDQRCSSIPLFEWEENKGTDGGQPNFRMRLHIDADTRKLVFTAVGLSLSRHPTIVTSERRVQVNRWNSAIAACDLRHVTLYLNSKLEGGAFLPELSSRLKNGLKLPKGAILFGHGRGAEAGPKFQGFFSSVRATYSRTSRLSRRSSRTSDRVARRAEQKEFDGEREAAELPGENKTMSIDLAMGDTMGLAYGDAEHGLPRKPASKRKTPKNKLLTPRSSAEALSRSFLDMAKQTVTRINPNLLIFPPETMETPPLTAKPLYRLAQLASWGSPVLLPSETEEKGKSDADGKADPPSASASKMMKRRRSSSSAMELHISRGFELMGFDPLGRSSIKLSHVHKRLPKRPRVLHCHDMRGGYTGDTAHQRNVASCSRDGGRGGYNFSRWGYIDIFCYFSHHLVTIPPKGWIDAAHRNGVFVLGTLIVEWDKGKEVWEQMIQKPNFYTSKLVGIQRYYGFDGWLINIESQGDAKKTLQFVKTLCNQTKRQEPHSLIIWYDSLTVDGKVQYQNRLNGNNEPFFDACDGILTNYAWKQTMPGLSAKTAGEDRAYDVYTGVDVFGRGTYMGGGFNTYKALEEIKRGGTSVALFAPGWTYEVASEGKGRAAFERCERKFWEGIDFSENLIAKAAAPLRTPVPHQHSGKKKKSRSTIEGWDILQSGGQGFSIEKDSDGQSWWVCSHEWCERARLVDISSSALELRESEGGGRVNTDAKRCDAIKPIVCEVVVVGKPPNTKDLYRVKWEVLDSEFRVIAEFDSGVVEASGQRASISHTFSVSVLKEGCKRVQKPIDEKSAGKSDEKPGEVEGISLPKFLRWTDKGRDAERWGGNYGVMIGECSVFLLDHCASVRDFRPRPRSRGSLRVNVRPFVSAFNNGLITCKSIERRRGEAAHNSCVYDSSDTPDTHLELTFQDCPQVDSTVPTLLQRQIEDALLPSRNPLLLKRTRSTANGARAGKSMISNNPANVSVVNTKAFDGGSCLKISLENFADCGSKLKNGFAIAPLVRFEPNSYSSISSIGNFTEEDADNFELHDELEGHAKKGNVSFIEALAYEIGDFLFASSNGAETAQNSESSPLDADEAEGDDNGRDGAHRIEKDDIPTRDGKIDAASNHVTVSAVVSCEGSLHATLVLLLDGVQAVLASSSKLNGSDAGLSDGTPNSEEKHIPEDAPKSKSDKNLPVVPQGTRFIYLPCFKTGSRSGEMRPRGSQGLEISGSLKKSISCDDRSAWNHWEFKLPPEIKACDILRVLCWVCTNELAPEGTPRPPPPLPKQPKHDLKSEAVCSGGPGEDVKPGGNPSIMSRYNSCFIGALCLWNERENIFNHGPVQRLKARVIFDPTSYFTGKKSASVYLTWSAPSALARHDGSSFYYFEIFVDGKYAGRTRSNSYLVKHVDFTNGSPKLQVATATCLESQNLDVAAAVSVDIEMVDSEKGVPIIPSPEE